MLANLDDLAGFLTYSSPDCSGLAAVLTNLNQWWTIIYYVHDTDKDWRSGEDAGCDYSDDAQMGGNG